MGKTCNLIQLNIFFLLLLTFEFTLEMILPTSMKESSSSRTLKSLFLILSLNNFFGSSLRELGISFHNLAPILEKAFFLNFKS